MSETLIVHVREPYDVVIGRPSIFGNPFKIHRGQTREQVIEKYRAYFYERVAGDRAFANAVWALKGKRLGCYCKPLMCHGDVIVEWINAVGRG